MRAKLIGDAYYRDNDERFAWVGHDNWTYTRDFQLKEEHTHHRRILLVAHGIDTVATVYVNDVPVGETDNMFVRYVFDIKQYIKVGYNNVSVEFTSAVAVAYARERSHAFSRGHQVPPECPPVRQRGECGVNHVRKVQASFSWEMAPAFPTQGIWKDIGIEMYDTLIIRDMVVRTQRLGPKDKDDQSDSWALDVGLFLEVAFSGKARILLNLVLDERLTVKKNISVSANNELTAHYRFRLRIPESLGIEAWWPNGHGVQRLYPLSVSLSMGSDTATMIKSIGFRTVDLVQEPLVNSTGATFFLRVNGLPLFAKGSTWIPADAFPDRVTGERLEALLDAAAAAHMNLLRVWGGGLYESDLFYELADRRGLMVWQDFAFASALYPATPEFLDSVAREARQQVRRLGHHASVILWCGNSENELGLAYNWWKLLTTEHRDDYVKLYMETLQKVVYEEDMSRPFVGSTPSNGVLSELSGGIHDNPNDVLYGDVHYFDYYSPPWSLESTPTPRFCSSFGLVSFPAMETLATALESGDLVLPFPQALENRMHLANARLETYMSAVVTLPKKDGTEQSLRIFILLSQIYQAMGVKTQAEHYRRQRLVVHRSQGLTMGAIYWHLNDVWQAPSWSSIDYNGNWKMLHYFAKRFFEPLLVSPYDEDGRLIVYVLDDLYRGQPYELLLQVKLYHYASLEPKASISHNITVARYAQPVYVANISKLLASASCNLNNSFLTFNLLNGTENETLSTNFLLLQVPRFAKDIASVTLKVTDVTADTPVGPETGQAKTPDDKAKKNVSSTTDEASLNRTSHGPKIEYSNGSIESGQTPVSESLTNLGHTSLQENSEGTSPDAMTDKANVHVIGLTTDGIALFVWLSAGKVKGHFSDNGFIMTERKGTVTFTSDLSVTTEHLRANLTVTCLNCLFKYHYSPMAEAKA
ncbi:beta-mannosidase-like [Amblyomma americanum]